MQAHPLKLKPGWGAPAGLPGAPEGGPAASGGAPFGARLDAAVALALELHAGASGVPTQGLRAAVCLCAYLNPVDRPCYGCPSTTEGPEAP